MKFKGIKMIPVESLGVSQIYLNEVKIKNIEKWFKPKNMDLFNPLTVYNFGNNRYTLTDGHSRAYVAYKNGVYVVPISYDTDEIVTNDLGQILYKTDIEWCNRFDLKSICDLQNRIVSDKTYKKLWIDRCDRSYNLLTQITKDEILNLQKTFPEMYLYGMSADKKNFYYETREGHIYVYDGNVIEQEHIFV